MIRERILFRLFFSLLLLLSFSPFCTYEPTSQIHPKDATDVQVKTSLLKILDVTDTQITDFYGYEGKGDGSKKGTQTFTVVVKDASSKTDKELMKTVAANLQNLDSLNEKYEAANADYTYTYNSKVAMVKVEKDGTVYRFVVASIDCVTDGVLTED